MKYFILVPDGAADYPLEQLNGKTALEASSIPNLDSLAVKSLSGQVRTVPEGFEPGSDVANLSIMGYDPSVYYPGRGPLEAAYHGINIKANQTAFRCNLVTVEEERLVDYSAGHIKSSQSAKLIGYLSQIINDADFYAGVSYRNLAVVDGDYSEMKFYPPHDVIGKKLNEIYPQGNKRDFFIELYEKSRNLLEDHPVNNKRIAEGLKPANMVWLWGGGKDVKMPSFEEKYAKKGAVISAVDLLKGIAKKIKMEIVEVPGATGYLDTNYSGKVKAALKAAGRVDVIMVHVEAPDEAGHSGDPQLKIQAIQDFDSKIIKPLLEGLKDTRFRLLLLPDHYTPLSVKTHVGDPVPFMLYDSAEPFEATAKAFSEYQLTKNGFAIEKGHELLEKMLFANL